MRLRTRRCTKTAGFTGHEAHQAAAHAVFTFVLGNALGAAAGASFRRKLARHGDLEEQMRANRAEAVEVAMKFPRLRTRVDTPSVDYASGPDGGFEFGLRTVLDGLEGRIEPVPARHAGQGWSLRRGNDHS